MKRFAIYFSPSEDSPLTKMAAAWLGRDAFSTVPAPPPDAPRNGFSWEVWRAATSEPRRYGFHATLKPPFRLVASAREVEFLDHVQWFAQTQKSFQAPALAVSSLSSFLALTLTEPSPEFQQLADACVREFDVFRAPPTQAELLRRRRARLTPKQQDYLDQWGYPYVMDEWRFHMTLTSSLEVPLFEQIGKHLRDVFAPFCGNPVTVDSLCVFMQAEEAAPFQVIERFGLL
jgi:putative phosphonate metabolism protein